MSKRVMFLDYQATRAHKLMARADGRFLVDWAQTAVGAIGLLASNDYATVMLDHDLAEEHYGDMPSNVATGYEVAAWMVARPERFVNVRVIVHSLNAPAAQRIVATLDDAGIGATHEPFAWERL